MKIFDMVLKKKLQREHLYNLVIEWEKRNDKNITEEDYVIFLEKVENEINKYSYEINENFFTLGRRDFLKKENSENLMKRDRDRFWRYSDVLINIEECIRGNLVVPANPELGNWRELGRREMEYYNSGIICEQEKEMLLDMIKEFKNQLKDIIRKRDKIRGSLVAGAIGDALGYPIEFDKGIKEKQVAEYINGKGIISDDTQMTLFTANALLWGKTRMITKGIAPSYNKAIYLSYLDWLETQIQKENMSTISWIKNIQELRIDRCPGNTCLASLKSGKMGTIKEPINDSKGCGTVMRIAPIGLFIEDTVEAGILAAESSAITHGNELAMIPSCFAAMLINILLNQNLNLEDAVKETIELYQNKINIFSKENNECFMNLVLKAIDLSKEDLGDVVAIKQLGEGWVAEEAFAIALYSCLKYQNSIKDALVCAINHDGDSDSTGAIAGNIIGAALGYSNIDEKYLENLQLKDLILEIADDLFIMSEDPQEKIYDNVWEKKYIYCKFVDIT